ncbi:putative ribonuclease H-like domain-containing protein [Tanacetum coccineum]
MISFLVTPRVSALAGCDKDNRSRNQDNSRKTVNVEETSSKAMVAIDGAGFDWSFMGDEEVPTNMALMAFSNSELNKPEFDLATYKRGLTSVEEQLVFYKKNEIEKLKKEKESNQIKINNFENASKSLDKLIGSLFAPPTVNLSNSGLEEFQQPKFEGYEIKVNKSVCEKSSNEVQKTPDAPIIEYWVSDCDEDKSKVRVLKYDNVQQKPNFSHLIKDCEFHDKKMVQKSVVDNVKKGTCQREVRPVWNNAMRVNHQNFSNSRRNFAPTTILTKSDLVPISVARRSFHQTTTLTNRNLKEEVNTVKHAGFRDLKFKSKIMSPKTVDHTLGDPQDALKDTRIFDSGCSRHMTGNKSYLTDYQDYDGGFVAVVGSSKGGRITGKGKIRTRKLNFEDVYFVKELKFKLLSVSQMCDKKNGVLFTETECLILSPDFKLPDGSQVLLKVPKKNNMYRFDLKNVVPSKGLTCLFEKAINDESKMWHMRLGHINFKTMNKLVKGNLVRGFPSKIFENDHTCVACQKGKQHKASCKSKLVNSVSQPLQILHMDLFGLTFVKSIMGKMYCLVVTDDYSKFSWVFFLAKKDESSGILKDFITGIENQLNHKVKIMRCDNRTEFKNYEMNQFCGIKGIKREFNSLLPIPFWAEAVNTACYVHNRVLVTKPHNKTPYELLIDRAPIVSFMRPFGCLVTILNTLDHLGSETNSNAGQARKEKVPDQEYILLPLMHTSSYFPSSSEEAKSTPKDDAGKKETDQPACDEGSKTDDLGSLDHHEKSEDDSKNINSTNSINTASPTINVADALEDYSKMINLEDTNIFDDAYDNRDEGAEADYNNLETIISVSPIPSTRVHTDHPKDQIIREVHSAVQTRRIWNQRRLLGLWMMKAGAIGTKWVFRNRKDQRGIVVRNKARLVAQGHRQEEGIDYDAVFVPVKRIEAIRQPLRFVDLEYPDRVYKVEKALYGLHQAPRAWYETLSTYLLENGFRRGTIDKTLFIKKIKNDILLVKQRKDGIFLSQDKYVYDILKKFVFSSVKIASTPMETHKPLSKDEMEQMLMFTYIVKRMFRYLKGQPTLGLWYHKDSPLELIDYSDSDYASASLERKFTTGGCQFLGSRLISWQCKKQTIVANFTTEAEYIAASNCCGQVLWLQNQLLYYGYNFMQTKIHVDNESAICVMKNHVYHSKTKYIEIRHHFIRDSYEKKLIEMVKIHTDYNVADLLTKAFDVARFQFLIASIVMLNP